MTNYHGKIILTLCTIKWLDLLAFFYRIRHRLSCELFFENENDVFCIYVIAHLCYGIEIYGTTYHSSLNKLIILNNKIPRILQNESYRCTHVTEFL